MNQPIREALPTPTGWLVAPTRDFCLFFIRDPKSVMVAESAHETWNELLSNDWELVEHQFGACVDAA